jgi:hypothetical protein
MLTLPARDPPLLAGCAARLEHTVARGMDLTHAALSLGADITTQRAANKLRVELWRRDTAQYIDRIFSRPSNVQQQEASHNA